MVLGERGPISGAGGLDYSIPGVFQSKEELSQDLFQGLGYVALLNQTLLTGCIQLSEQ